MLRKIFLAIAVLMTAFIISTKLSYAEQYGQGTYGQGVVLGKGEELVLAHETVDAGLKENLPFIGGSFFVASFIFLSLSKKEKQRFFYPLK